MTRWQRLVAFMGRPEQGTSWALFRILVALTAMGTILETWRVGVAPVVWVDVELGGYRALGPGSFVMGLIGGPTPVNLAVVSSLSVVSAGALALGVGGAVGARVVAFVALQSFMAVVDINSHAGGSYDELLANALWLLVLGGPSRTLSVHCWRTTGRWQSEETIPLWPRMLVVYQAVLMYGTTGLQKLSAHWVPGGDFSALYYILQQPSWQLADARWLAPLYPLTQLGTAVSWFWEVTAPVWFVAWVWSLSAKDGLRARIATLRWVYLAVGVMFHVSIEFFMNIGPFSAASLAYYTAFVHPDEWRRLMRRLPSSRSTEPPTEA